MKRTILFIAWFSGMALQNGLGQNFTQQRESTNLLVSRFGSGEAGDGIWLGTRSPQALYFKIRLSYMEAVIKDLPCWNRDEIAGNNFSVFLPFAPAQEHGTSPKREKENERRRPEGAGRIAGGELGRGDRCI